MPILYSTTGLHNCLTEWGPEVGIGTNVWKGGISAICLNSIVLNFCKPSVNVARAFKLDKPSPRVERTVWRVEQHIFHQFFLHFFAKPHVWTEKCAHVRYWNLPFIDTSGANVSTTQWRNNIGTHFPQLLERKKAFGRWFPISFGD